MGAGQAVAEEEGGEHAGRDPVSLREDQDEGGEEEDGEDPHEVGVQAVVDGKAAEGQGEGRDQEEKAEEADTVEEGEDGTREQEDVGGEEGDM